MAQRTDPRNKRAAERATLIDWNDPAHELALLEDHKP
jgi:hypothetical protein